MVEPIAMKLPDAGSGGYLVDGDAAEDRAAGAPGGGAGRRSAEGRSDGRRDDFARVVRVAGAVPVLARGGGKADEAEVFARTHALMPAGARGIVYGRNVIQHPDPTAMTRAFMAIVHRGATPAEALALLRG